MGIRWWAIILIIQRCFGPQDSLFYPRLRGRVALPLAVSSSGAPAIGGRVFCQRRCKRYCWDRSQSCNGVSERNSREISQDLTRMRLGNLLVRSIIRASSSSVFTVFVRPCALASSHSLAATRIFHHTHRP